MNILILNANNPYKASGVVALNLFNDFKIHGHNVKLLTKKYDTNYTDGIISMESYYLSLWENSKLKNKVSYLRQKFRLVRDVSIDSKYEFIEFKEQKRFYKTKYLLRKANFKPDAIIILFAKKFINTRNIYELYEKTHAPIYWLMYDMAPITGGCHYSWECMGYKGNCGECPGLFSSDPFDITYKNMLYKKHFIDKTNLQIIAASEWQYRQTINSSIFKDKLIHKILLSVDPNIFKPTDKAKERIKTGIPANKKVVFFGSIALTTIRKGMLYLLECFNILKDLIKNTTLENDIILLIAGSNIEGIADNLPFDYHYLGLVDNTFGIASAYQLADVFICPSVEDSGPTMINQSIMCGTPVISFEMGVALDLVITGETGYRAKMKDSKDLAQGLYKILTLSDDSYRDLSNNCRELALKVCSPKVQIELFENLFKN
jgi:glycosyltransferase involved in cell wall biosynthesis